MFPAMEPEFCSPAIEEHALFADGLHNFEKYLEDILGWEKNEKGKAVPVPGKAKLPYDADKIRVMLEEMMEPLFSHVSRLRRGHRFSNDQSLTLVISQLKKEIGYIDPDKIRATGLSKEKLENLSKVADAHFQNDVVRTSSPNLFELLLDL